MNRNMPYLLCKNSFPPPSDALLQRCSTDNSFMHTQYQLSDHHHIFCCYGCQCRLPQGETGVPPTLLGVQRRIM